MREKKIFKSANFFCIVQREDVHRHANYSLLLHFIGKGPII